MKKSLLLLALMAAMMWTGCQNQIEPEDITGRPEEKTPKTLTVTIQAVKADAPDTKGLSIGDNKTEDLTEKLQSIWKAGEKVFVYKETGKICELTLGQNGNVIDGTDAHKATLTFTTDQITERTTLTLLTPRESKSYEGQTGKLFYETNETTASIEKNFHYTMATVTATVSGETVTTSPATFENQQSIYRLSFRYGATGSNTKTQIKTKSVTISATAQNGGFVKSWDLDGTAATKGDITVNRSASSYDANSKPQWDSNPFFVALRNSRSNITDDEVFTFTVIDGDGVTYKGSKTIPAEVNVNGKFISIKNATLNDRLDVPLNTSAAAAVGTAL